MNAGTRAGKFERLTILETVIRYCPQRSVWLSLASNMVRMGDLAVLIHPAIAGATYASTIAE